ncbi:hypothetical protein [Aminobacter aminovorans]|uniref:Uncharacterized protein n=1 Tax=Aminobacter aminovorans TaxID=83263 RepID=A0AAC8YNE8_AMIAI|nr:hypothetical protein [Aminobacter aminovorans]AMS41179.1 hypothetical protein AA2016_2251 [Aminobacter aminovorans]MBB3705838.1 hypothetical protein [Aminobacter aminovorans]
MTVHDLCAEFGIRIIDGHRYPEVGETRAVATLERILRRYGEGHLRLVLTTLAETANNKVLLDEVGLWMASDLIRACAGIVESRADDWLQTWDAMPVGELQFICQDLRGFVPQRTALGGMVYERIFRRFGQNAGQFDLFDDRRAK